MSKYHMTHGVVWDDDLSNGWKRPARAESRCHSSWPDMGKCSPARGAAERRGTVVASCSSGGKMEKGESPSTESTKTKGRGDAALRLNWRQLHRPGETIVQCLSFCS